MYVRSYRTEYRHCEKCIYIVKLYKWIWLCCVYVHDWTTTKYYVHEAFRQRVVFSTYILYHNQIKTHIVLQAKSKLYRERENGERARERKRARMCSVAHSHIYSSIFYSIELLKCLRSREHLHIGPRCLKLQYICRILLMPKPILSSGWVNGDIH